MFLTDPLLDNLSEKQMCLIVEFPGIVCLIQILEDIEPIIKLVQNLRKASSSYSLLHAMNKYSGLRLKNFASSISLLLTNLCLIFCAEQQRGNAITC